MADAFYLPDGDDRFESTQFTRGPWDPRHQHAGPPAALLCRAIERLPAEREMRVARVTLEILRPIPIAPLTVSARVARPGRSVELVEGAIDGAEGEELVRARAWRIRTADVEAPEAGAPDRLADGGPPAPEDSEPTPFFDFGGESDGYHTAMDTRVAGGSFHAPGPAAVWMRMRIPLVADEPPSPLARVMVAADSGNGVSWTLDFSKALFVNTDLTVSVHRPPAGEWVCIDARTTIEPNGSGLTDTRLWDRDGAIGRAMQTLLVDTRR